MIKSDKGHVMLAGTPKELLGDLYCVIDGLHEGLSKEIGEKDSKDLLKVVFKGALKGNVSKETKVNITSNKTEEIKDVLERMFK